MLYNLQKFTQDFIQFSPSELFKITYVFNLKYFSKGQIVFPAGQVVRQLYFLNKGVLKIYKYEGSEPDEVKFYLNPTFLTDLQSIQSNQVSLYTLITMSEVELYHADFKTIHSLMQQSAKHHTFFSSLFTDRYLFNVSI
jgi:signal-transduction protein with cAMP-binding, CBS, and nucleotidyltransferase domain